jgi:hypothetical protein
MTCPACGHQRKPVAGVNRAEGSLVQLTGKKPAPTMADKQAFWSMALWLDQQRGKGGRLAKALYKGKFDVWPKGLMDVPKHPTQDFMNYEHSRRIAYAYKQNAAKGTAA